MINPKKSAVSTKPYKRILLKLSGETLMGSQPFGIDSNACKKIAQTIKEMQDAGLQLAIVIGGGNIFRGISLNELGVERSSADQMGMLGTLINGIALQQALSHVNCRAMVMSALECPKVAETYNWHKALEALNSNTVLIFVGGTGNPYFTTDTAAAMRASEIHADIFLKATKVDGIYDKDPLKHSDAIKYKTITYSQILADKLGIMDSTATALCRSNHIPILVFNMNLLGKEPIQNILSQHQGTIVTE
jgi:uridylate kinase